MSRLTHAICEACWKQRKGERTPICMRDATNEMCCFCGNPTNAGIYIMEKPDTPLCKGRHPFIGVDAVQKAAEKGFNEG